MNNSACDLSDARRNISGVTTRFSDAKMDNSSCDLSDARRKICGMTIKFSDAKWTICHVTSVMPKENSQCDD